MVLVRNLRLRKPGDPEPSAKFVRKRRSPRRPMNMPCYLYTRDGWPLGKCTMKDISDSGAQLLLSDISELPRELLLSLSHDGAVRRPCDLVWRNGDRVGVRFVT
jgi:hypothetical protein